MKVLAIKYSKISVNIPVELLTEFDKICEVHSYSRAEGIKEAIRQFIYEQMPEEYFSPQMKQVMNESIREQSVEWMKGIAQAAADPEVQKLQIQANKQAMIEGAKQGAIEGSIVGIEKRFAEQGASLSEEQKLQMAQALQSAREKTIKIQKEKTEAKQKLRKKI